MAFTKFQIQARTAITAVIALNQAVAIDVSNLSPEDQMSVKQAVNELGCDAGIERRRYGIFIVVRLYQGKIYYPIVPRT
jgi:hypothetical protein